MALIRILPKGMNEEGGFVLVGAMLILLLLMLIGISASNTTTMEIHIAASDRVRKESFAQADGGAQLAIRLVEESLGTPGGFTDVTAGVLNYPVPYVSDPFNPQNTILMVDLTMAEDEGVPALPSDAARDAAYFPEGYDPDLPNAPHTNINVGGVTSVSEGAGLQMVAGYEGKGKGTAGGGGQILYTIYSQHLGKAESESVVQVDWRHVIGLELEGRY